jgi:DNA invertase Pin-like site-specific DNA recombinase
MAQTVTPPDPSLTRKAYSYLRFSTPEQAKGDSRKRQSDLASAYAAAHGLVLDDELRFEDLGRSAFRGGHAATGALAAFLEEVASGNVPPGSLLLIESLDRLSREAAFDAQLRLSGIVQMGVDVVTLMDGRVYSLETLRADPMGMIYAIMGFMRAHDESAHKSRRLKASWAGKRAQIASGKPLTGRLPGWLRLSADRSQLEVIEERAVIVRRIFDLTLAGVGQHTIAATFNREGVEPWGTGKARGKQWHRSYIAKIVSNPAVIGTFQPHVIEYEGATKRRRPLEAVEGYFPAIIAPEVFREAQALGQSRGAPQRGRHAHAPLSNLLAGLAACPKCDATMTRVAKGKRSRPSYVCTRAKSGGECQYKSVRCDLIEAVLLQGLPERLRDLEGVRGAEPGLDQRVEVAQERVDALQEAVEALVDNLSHERSAALARRLRNLEGDLEAAQESLKNLQERQEATTGLTVMARVNRALEALQPSSGEPLAPAVNLALRSLFNRVVIDWTVHELVLEWKHGGTMTMPYPSFKRMPGPGWVWQSEEEDDEG